MPCTRSLRPQRNHRIHCSRTPSRQPAGDYGDRGEEGGGSAECDDVGGRHPEQERREQACSTEGHECTDQQTDGRASELLLSEKLMSFLTHDSMGLQWKLRTYLDG